MTALKALHVIVPAAGIGRRMGPGKPKQYLPLAGQTLLECTLARLREALPGVLFHVPLQPGDPWWSSTVCAADPLIRRLEGGQERADSVRLGLAQLSAGERDWVLVHDVARPCVTTGDIHRLLDAVMDHDCGGLLGVPVADTLKQVGSSQQVTATVDRSGLWRALTPQVFRYGPLCRALDQASARGLSITDEASAMEFSGATPLMVPGRGDNLKVTLPEDLALAGWLLRQQGSTE
ncbi:MAG: 2-C-methyl-D-erythritol 4-phosphate cytidylyltransferase [Oleiphilaceae bacterium]|nr:2-C-methyl-D-erythritol 4-phosphate cytidylyltransferase [Oleiphilaceae bacterium]